MVGELSTATHLEYVTERCAQLAVELATLDELVRSRVRALARESPHVSALQDPVFNALSSAITLMREKHQKFERTRLELLDVPLTSGDGEEPRT